MAGYIGERRTKRHFRARQKLKTPNLVYHITQRAAGKEPLFLEEKEHLYMLWLLKEVAQKYSLTLFAFCLMPNHVHLLLSPKEENLYDAMQNLFSRYAMMFNRKYQRKGHLFGGPYRQAVCLDDAYLLTASLYIHLNPVRAGLVDDVLDYRWSSLELYVKDDAPKSFVAPDFILNFLSGGSPEKRKKYRQLLQYGAKLCTGEVMEEQDTIERFCYTLRSQVPSFMKWIAKKTKGAVSPSEDFLDMEVLERRINEIKATRSHNNPESYKAKRVVIEQLISRGYNREEIAERLGMSRKTIYNVLKSTQMMFIHLAILLPISGQTCFG